MKSFKQFIKEFSGTGSAIRDAVPGGTALQQLQPDPWLKKGPETRDEYTRPGAAGDIYGRYNPGPYNGTGEKEFTKRYMEYTKPGRPPIHTPNDPAVRGLPWKGEEGKMTDERLNNTQKEYDI